MQGKSSLNPNATPYVPLFSRPLAERQKPVDKLQGELEYNEDSMLPAEYHLPDSVSVDYEVQSLEKLSLSGESSSKMSQQDYPDEFFHDDLAEFGDQNLMDDPKLKLEYLSSIFPEISVESLAELLTAHGGDLNETIDVVQQLEYDGDVFEYPFQAADTGSSSTHTSQKGSK